jgi:hypothetical protein
MACLRKTRDMPVQRSPHSRPVLASALAAAGIVLTVASCTGNITPLGPNAAATMPAPRHLGSPIIVQAMRVQLPTAAGGCPAGWVAVSLPAGGGPRHGAVRAVPVVPPGASASPASPVPPPPPAPVTCYRPAGAPVTITSAAVSSVFTYRPPPGQAKGPDLYGFIVAVPGADVAAVTAIIRQAVTLGAPSASASPVSSGKPPKHGSHSRVSSSRSPCLAGIKLCGFTACWSPLADGGGRHDGLARWPTKNLGERAQRHLSARSSPWLSPARNPIEGPATDGTPGLAPHARRHRSPDTCGCRVHGDHVPDHRDSCLAPGSANPARQGAHEQDFTRPN